MTAGQPDVPSVEALTGELDAVADDLESAAVGARVEETKALIAAAGRRGLLDSGQRHLQPRDAAEALVGSVVFSAPLLVEDGVFDIAAHLFGANVAGLPVYLIANTVFVVVMTYALVEWTGRNRAESHHLLGVVPTRVVMILGVSFAAAAVLMTVWGRVDPIVRPGEALARITVLWTVGAIGAGLGDIIANEDRQMNQRAVERSDAEPVPHLSDGALVANLQDQLDTLARMTEHDAEERELRRLQTLIQEATVGDRFGQQIRKYTSRDIAEAFVGSVVFAIPLLVEDGVFDAADYFLAFRLAGFPVFFLVNAGFVLAMIGALVYWAGPQRVAVSRPILGVIPRRLVGIGLVSFLSAALLMTMWGRVDGWQDPVVAIARISAVWTVASFGAALGDILPGESSGDDLYDDIGEFVGDLGGETDADG